MKRPFTYKLEVINRRDYLWRINEQLTIIREGVEAWNKWRRTADTGVDLSDSILTETDLSGADLSEANLCRAHLYLADLRGAILYLANLSGASLREVNVSGSNLEGALIE